MLFIPQQKVKESIKGLQDEWKEEKRKRDLKRREEYCQKIKNREV